MNHISKRSLKASKEGVQLASRAILRFPTKIDFAVELEISRSTVQNFFAGKPIGRENFHKICQELELSWQEVAELPPESPKLPKLTVIEPEIIQNNHNNQITKNDLVSEFRLLVQSRIWSMCGAMRVLDMSCPKLIEDIYVSTQVYTKIKSRRRLEIEQIYPSNVNTNADSFDFKLSFNETEPQEISGWAAAMCYSKLIVLGKPGSGKTMFLKHLTLQCLNGVFKPDYIPIFVPLRDFVAYNPSLSLIDYISNQLTKDCQPPEINQVRQLLDQGKFLIFLDGLDEVKILDRYSICQHLRRFTEWFPDNHYIISCRHGVQYCNFEQFTEVEISDFQPEQIEEFTVKWFAQQDAGQNPNFLQELNKNNSIQEFTTNPLLLTLLCILFEESANFPSSRLEIYEEGLDIMLRQWDAERLIERRTGEDFTLEEEKGLLRTIARKTFERNQYFFKEGDLKFYIAEYAINCINLNSSKLDTKKILKSVEAKHGLLVEQAKKVYSFSHLVFQEYLTAKEFSSTVDSVVSTRTLENLVSHITESRWREIFLLVAEMTLEADQLFLMMSQQVNSLCDYFPNIKIFLEWLNCKAESVIISTYENSHKNQVDANKTFNDHLDKCQLEKIRAFYFDLGFNQILGRVGSNFSIALKLDPDFSRLIACNPELALDLSLFNLFNLLSNLELVKCPALTLQRSVDRVITHAAKIEPELAEELRNIEPRLLGLEDNTNQFWLWWHQLGRDWSNSVHLLAVKYRNVAHQWKFDSQEQKVLKQYYRANLLLLDCLNRSSHASAGLKQKIKQQLLNFTKIKGAILFKQKEEKKRFLVNELEARIK